MKSLWNEKDAKYFAEQAIRQGDSPDLGLRVYSSQLIGKIPDLVLHGGGNTSVKLTKHGTKIMHVKGSGWDLETIEAQGLPALRLAPLLAARLGKKLSDPEMVALFRSNLLDKLAPNPSVEALLHAFLPHKYVDHTHATAILVLANQKNSKDIMTKIYGNELAFVPYVMPGYELSVKAANIYSQHQSCGGLWLKNHGLFTFANSAYESYEQMIKFVSKAEDYLATKNISLPKPELSDESIDSSLAQKIKKALQFDGSSPFSEFVALDFRTTPSIRSYVSRKNLDELSLRGTVTPDHVIRTKPFPLLICANDSLSDILVALEDYKGRYAAYFERNAQNSDDKKIMLDPWPRMILIRKVGLIGLGCSKEDARIVSDLGEQTARIINAAEEIGSYCPVSKTNLFNMEYWSLEQAKLKK